MTSLTSSKPSEMFPWTREVSPKVFVSPLGPDTSETIRQGLNYINASRLLTPGTHVFIKPNLTFPQFRPGVTTTPAYIENVIIALKDYSIKITIGEADSGGFNRFSMQDVYRELGIDEICKRYAVDLVNLYDLPRTNVPFGYEGRAYQIPIPNIFSEQIDFTITLPVPKIHMNSGVSLSFKNQWGCIPDPKDRLRLHPAFKQAVLEINKHVKTKMVLADGTYGLNDSGPMLGTPEKLDVTLISDDIGAAAVGLCRLMGIDYKTISHLKYAEARNWIPDLNSICYSRPPEELCSKKFSLKRKLTDLPGLTAFNNNAFAWLIYFSPASDLLHKAYSFIRKPFY